MKQRIITAIVALAIFIPFVFNGGIPFVVFTYLMATIALHEFFRMRKQNILTFSGLLSIFTLWIILLPSSYNHLLVQIGYTKVELIFIAVLLFLTYTVLSKNRFTYDDVGASMLTALYVGIGFYYLIETRDAGISYIFYALLIIWMTDSGAYFVGRSIGKHKLWPEISPNKTKEGFLGGILFALLVGIGFAVFTDIGNSYTHLFIVTIVLSIFGQIGDLVESALKRHYNVKDSGYILPGHGGILDRFDSLLFVLPLLHILRFI